MRDFNIVKRCKNPAFSDKPSFFGALSEGDARQKAGDLNVKLSADSEYFLL